MADDQLVDIVEVFPGKDKKWYYHGKSNNGQVLFSSEGYNAKGTAVDTAVKIAESHGASMLIKGEADK